jgi:Fibronectin type III domain
MKRAGLFFIAIAAAATIACGSSDNEPSSPTGPSSSSPGSNPGPQPSCTAPSTPGNLAVASIAGTAVTLTWSGANGATEYLVLVGTTPSSSNTLSTNTSQTNYTWTVSPGTHYARIQAKNACGTSGSSNEVIFTVAG